MNLLDRLRPSRRGIGRVPLPDVDQERIDAVRAEMDWNVRQRKGYLLGMLSHGRPIAARPKPARKQRSKTAHVRRMEQRRAAALMARAQRGEVVR